MVDFFFSHDNHTLVSVELQGGLNDVFLVNFVLPRIYALGVFHLYVIDAKQIRK